MLIHVFQLFYFFRCKKGRSWKEHFISLFEEYGHYTYYREIRQAWNKIESFLARSCPAILASLQGTCLWVGTYCETLTVFVLAEHFLFGFFKVLMATNETYCEVTHAENAYYKLLLSRVTWALLLVVNKLNNIKPQK